MNLCGNLTRLRYFQAVCKYNGMTKAAEALCVSQPSLTTAIKELERELGITLFNRTKNSLQLTEQGKFVLEKLDKMMEAFDTGYNEIIDMGEHANKSARLGVTPIMGTIFTPRIIRDFPKAHPDINLSMYECATGEALALLDDREIDLAFVMGTEFDEKYNYKIIYEAEMCLCVNDQCHLTEYNHVTCKDIGDTPLIIQAKGSSSYDIITNIFKEAGAEPNIVMESGQLYTIYEIIKSRDIATITYKEVFEKRNGIRTIPFAEPIKVKIAILWNKDSYTNKTISSIVKFMKETYSNIQE